MDLNSYLPPRVAVLEVSGVIGARLHAREFTQLLRAVEENSRYHAVVLDIDSPGGSAFASEDIYLSTKRLAARKPVAAAIRGVGASGSYMVACAAERIFALPSAVVGSIGVISARPMVEELLAKVGVEMIVSKSGRYKDMGSPFREPTKEERAKEQALIDAVYARFVEIVAAGRPELDEKRISELATGEIFLGAKAHEVGLVDDLGSVDDAIEWVANRAGIPAKPTILKPKRSLAQMVLSRGAVAFVDSVMTEVEDRIYARALRLPRG